MCEKLKAGPWREPGQGVLVGQVFVLSTTHQIQFRSQLNVLTRDNRLHIIACPENRDENASGNKGYEKATGGVSVDRLLS